jgi:transposase
MMGVQAAPAQLFYDFCLDDHVPSDHLLRSIDGHLGFEGLRQTLKPFYSQMGRPSVDPELMIRMLIVGYCMGIRSERRLCEEVHLNLAGMGCQLRCFRLARWEALGRVQASLRAQRPAASADRMG